MDSLYGLFCLALFTYCRGRLRYTLCLGEKRAKIWQGTTPRDILEFSSGTQPLYPPPVFLRESRAAD